ncbi:ATP-dependent Clp protease ATP-binding subunit [Pseudonocardia sp.]|uniref:ATP-dependent Clp protease ATP-binding subunit n=1 Tax=Pseudonocardia sp. TaxID=60912 RepID=UPI0025E8DDB3|nr:ATP-dependent Clp protease ATP-binding subunit [Pseudonocardia sp.]
MGLARAALLEDDMPDDPNPFGSLESLFGKLLGGLDGMDGMEGFGDPGRGPTRGTGRLDRFGRDLTAAARAGELDPVIGRADEVDQVLEVLARRTKNNPVLVGDPGVGKTAIVEGIAQRIAGVGGDGDVPAVLRDVRIVALDLAGMVAGTKYRGEFEERLTTVIDEVVAAGRQVVVFVDELHTVIGAGSAEGSAMDAATILKPMLARGELRLIGATTVGDYRRHIEKDPALERRFEPVTVPEPSVEETVAILRGLRRRYEDHHGVRISDAALEAAARLSDRYVRDRFLPDKAIDLIDRAAARAGMGAPAADAEGLLRAREVAVDAEDFERAMELTREIDRLAAVGLSKGAGEITADNVAQVVARRTGIPVASLGVADRDRLLNLEEQLHRRIVGQEAAVEAVADAVRAGRAGLGHPGRPVGSFLFLGPTGVGKTELARALAEALFGSPDRLVRLDMSEYADRSAVTRLIGAPPGHVGYDEAGQLTEAVRRDPYTVLLLDEIEKAHAEVIATLLQVLDAGRLTDARGRVVDFRHAIVIMTSNLGSEEILAGADPEVVQFAVRRHFRPEFLNRVDDVVPFTALGPPELRRITALLLDETRGRLRAQGVDLLVDDDAADVLARLGHRPELGARPLRRTIAREVERRLSKMLLGGEVRTGQSVRVVVDGDGVGLRVGG